MPIAVLSFVVRFALSSIVLVAALHSWEPAVPVVPFGTAEARDAAAPAAEAQPDSRAHALARAQVWMPRRIANVDITAGPGGRRAFPFRATVNCDYVSKDFSGASPKFACRAAEGDELKVKYGGTNAEVYAEVAATRLLWALGFGADHMYPVRVICRGCPRDLGGGAIERGRGEALIFDPASVERKMPGRELGDGWAWTELDLVDEDAGGAPRAHRDALKLLAVLIQHTDSKPVQQRLLCLDEAKGEGSKGCARPFLMLNDVGLTFGRANMFNANELAMNLAEWSATPVWKGPTGCVGNLPKSLTGTLDDPVISEEGRRFLADLLSQLSDDQIRAIFQVARVDQRLRDPRKARSGFSTADEWAAAFKQKRAEIVARRCA